MPMAFKKYRKYIKNMAPFLLTAMLLFSGCSEDTTDSKQASEQATQTESTQAGEQSDDVDDTEDAEDVDEDKVTENEETNAQQPAQEASNQESDAALSNSQSTIDLSSLPQFSGEPYIVINDNVPSFTEADMTTSSFETYHDLDGLGRCGTAFANIGQDLMPTEKRGAIGQVKPTGWHTVKYDSVDGKYLYNRCHLIGYQLTAENANEKNLITGTRYLNVDGMLPFENMVADYIKETNNHVLYRITPLFYENDLVARGVQMEAMSVEDNGDGILFNVYCYNAQPGITIDYATGDSWSDGTIPSESGTAAQTDESSDSSTQSLSENNEYTQADNQTENADTSAGATYILNIDSYKFHLPSCSSGDQMNEENKMNYTGSRDDLLSQGYDPCKRCNP